MTVHDHIGRDLARTQVLVNRARRLATLTRPKRADRAIHADAVEALTDAHTLLDATRRLYHAQRGEIVS